MLISKSKKVVIVDLSNKHQKEFIDLFTLVCQDYCYLPKIVDYPFTNQNIPNNLKQDEIIIFNYDLCLKSLPPIRQLANHTIIFIDCNEINTSKIMKIIKKYLINLDEKLFVIYNYVNNKTNNKKIMFFKLLVKSKNLFFAGKFNDSHTKNKLYIKFSIII